LAFVFYVRSLVWAAAGGVGLSMISATVANYCWLGNPLALPQLLGIPRLFIGIVLISPPAPRLLDAAVDRGTASSA
jgi:hypothetical protein